MSSRLPFKVKARRLCSKCAPVILLAQKTPLNHFLVQEARVIGTAGLTSAVKWSVATVAGLGAFDSVTGATTLTQIAPSRGSSTVPGTVGEVLSFIVQVTGAPSTAGSWQVIGALPAGLNHQNATSSNTDSINGIPTQSGNFPITIKAWEDRNFRGGSKSKSFTITVAGGEPPPTFTTQPASSAISVNGSVTLSVATSGTAPTFQWYMGDSGDTSNPIVGVTESTYGTPAIEDTTGYWVRVSNSAGAVDSITATVSVAAALDPFVSWQAGNFDASQLADPLISGATADPDGDSMTNATEYIFGTPPLTTQPSIAPSITFGAGEVSLSFTANFATGLGYSGLARHYALENSSASSLSVSTWTPIPDFADITGNDQVVTFNAPIGQEASYYRISVWLSPEE